MRPNCYKTILVYANLEPEYLIKQGYLAELNDEDVEMFRHFEEIPLILEEVPLILSVDSDGFVRKCEVQPGFLE